MGEPLATTIVQEKGSAGGNGDAAANERSWSGGKRRRLTRSPHAAASTTSRAGPRARSSKAGSARFEGDRVRMSCRPPWGASRADTAHRSICVEEASPT